MIARFHGRRATIPAYWYWQKPCPDNGLTVAEGFETTRLGD
jgi:hypothetical protein